jgi:hypothetical protein
MKVVTEAGNKNYFMIRAVEMIRSEYDSATAEARGLRQAIGLLVLAIAEVENGQAKITNKR